MNPFTLEGRRILVIGASSGIGLATAQSIAEMGGKVIAVGRNDKTLTECLMSIAKNDHSKIVCDITEENSIDKMILCLDKIDGLVYCAGTLQNATTKFITSAIINKQFDTNYFGFALLMAKLQQAKIINKRASIVCISSAAANYAIENGNAVYSSTKAALQVYARTLAKELAGRRIRVNCIAPGMVKTPFLTNFDVDEEEMAINEKKYPFGYGEPQDIANAAIYLLSDASKWMTGSVIQIDGGLSLT